MLARACSGLLMATAGAALLACSDAASAPDGTLTIHGAATAAPAAAALRGVSFSSHGETSGDPASMRVGLYALYLSGSADCSAPVLVQDYGSTAEVKDFVQYPVLFTGSPAAGAYPCVILRMSDVLRMVPATSFGPCVAGTEYSGDIYREGETDWKDQDLEPIVGSGTDDAPADDRVAIFLTRDRAAAEARGISPNQIVQLGSELIVPGQSTFYWNGEGSVQEEGGRCSLQPGRPEFR